MIDEKKLQEIESRSLLTLEQTLALFSTDDFNTPVDICDDLGSFGTDPCSNPRSHIAAENRYMFEQELRARDCEALAALAVREMEHGGGCRDRLLDLATAIRAQMPRQTDGLTANWIGWVFANFPYSNPLRWCERLHDHDDAWVALAKLDTTTRWWSVLMDSGATWAPFRARIKHEQPGKSMTSNFPSVLIWKRWHPPRAMQKRLWLPVYGVAA